MSVITSIEISHQLPLDPPFAPRGTRSRGPGFPVTIVRVTDSKGRLGIGSGNVM